MAEEGFLLDAQSLKKLQRMAAWFEGQNGPGTTNTPYGASSAPVRGSAGGTGHSPVRWFRVDASVATATVDANGNPVRWTYTVSEMYKATAGYGGWSVLSDGYTGAAYNFNEEGNDGTGRQMNGVDHDGADYPSTVSMQPIQDNAILPGVMVFAASGAVEVWLWSQSNEDGTCS